MIDNLTNGNVSYEVTIRFYSGVSIGTSYQLSFMTKRISPVEWPYIFIDSNGIDTKNGFALYVANASDASRVEWTYDGVSVKPGQDLLFHPTKSGTLKAIVKWKDGSNDIIIKEITVK